MRLVTVQIVVADIQVATIDIDVIDVIDVDVVVAIMDGARPIATRPPATVVTMMPAMVAVPVTAGVKSYAEWAIAPTQPETPSGPRNVVDMKAPRCNARVIVIR